MIQSEFEYFYNRVKQFLLRTHEDLFTDYEALSAEYGVSDDVVPWQERMSLDYRAINENEKWGSNWQSAWFHLTGTVPKNWAGQKIALRLNFGGEALIFDAKGVPFWSLTDFSVFEETYQKEMWIYPHPAKGGEKIDLWVEAAANKLMGITPVNDPHADRDTAPEGHFDAVASCLRLALFNEELWHLRLEFETVLSMLEHYYKDFTDYRAAKLLAILNRTCDIYCEDPRNAMAARNVLHEAFKYHALSSALSVTAVGHAHIDVGWLWPVKESTRKAARTFSNQLRMMEKYPDYVFGASQAYLYQVVKDHYPELFEQIKARVKEGRWEPQGGTWVECDCNIPSGESLIRQFIAGKNFFMDNFGIETKTLWEPDVFGYPAALPQIIRKSGNQSFLTQKLSWNKINHFPHNTFRWKGIDGTEVVTHFPPENNYNGFVLAGHYAKAQDHFEERATQPEFLSLFGMGDGGGGPKDEYVERLKLCRDFEGCPKVKPGKAQDFFDRLLADAPQELPVWNGELYFEMHRGTLTSQSRTKRGNRKLEQMLTLAEFINSALPDNEYPRAELDRLWKVLLLNQFHDIIPGSSIHRVYETTTAEHAQALKDAWAVTLNAAKKLLNPAANVLTLVNSLSCDYTRPIELPAEWSAGAVVTAEGRRVPTQVENDGRVFAILPLHAGVWETLKLTAGTEPAATEADSKLTLENSLIRYTFAKNGRLLSAVWLEDDRELLTAPGNVLSLYADFPFTYEAWDIDSYYKEEFVESAKAYHDARREIGPVRSSIHFALAIGNSTINQCVSLAANSPILEFHTTVDWKESRKMLRAAFPTAIQSDTAAYDIQYGFIKRPTHTNTSWDAAKFECCGQRYVDLSDEDFGIALLNDCKYGHRIHDNVLDLNLLRSPKWPDFTADQGKQEFTYALMPHNGRLIDSGVYQAAAQLNREPARFDGLGGTGFAPAQVIGKGLSLEVIKRAEKSNAIVVRIVETRGAHSKGVLKTGLGATVTRTNLIEWTNEGTLNSNAPGEFPLALKPFEILTLKIS